MGPARGDSSLGWGVSVNARQLAGRVGQPAPGMEPLQPVARPIEADGGQSGSLAHRPAGVDGGQPPFGHAGPPLEGRRRQAPP